MWAASAWLKPSSKPPSRLPSPPASTTRCCTWWKLLRPVFSKLPTFPQNSWTPCLVSSAPPCCTPICVPTWPTPSPVPRCPLCIWLKGTSRPCTSSASRNWHSNSSNSSSPKARASTFPRAQRQTKSAMGAVTSPTRVAVLGAGSWGTALAALACEQADTLLWARRAECAEEINTQHRNARYLPEISLPAQLRANSDFMAAVEHVCAAETDALIILGVPVAGMAETCHALATVLQGRQHPPLHVVWTCKGVHPDTGQLPQEVAGAVLGKLPGVNLGVLSGPS